MDEQTVWIVVLIPLLLAIAAAAVLCFFKSPARACAERRSRLRRLAQRLGLHYYGRADDVALSALPEFGLLQGGGTKTIANLMAENRRPPRMLLFDLQHTMSRGPLAADPNRPLLYQVAMACLSGGVRIVPARVFREDWLGGPADVPGLYRLELRDDPVFASGYYLAGEPREAVRAMLSEPVRRAIKAWVAGGPRPVIELLPDWVAVYVEADAHDTDAARKGERLIAYACGIAAALAGAASAESLQGRGHPG